jgi:hypothetical protein
MAMLQVKSSSSSASSNIWGTTTNSNWGTSPWSFGVDWCPVQTDKLSNFSSAMTNKAEDDLMRNLEFQALATLRELAIPMVDNSPKRLSWDERSNDHSRDHSPSSASNSSCSSSENGDAEYKSASGSASVFIGRLPFDLSEREFRTKLDTFGPMDSCICMNKRKKSKGFGFATFATEEQAAEFVEQANNAFLFGKQKLPLRVEICRREN